MSTVAINRDREGWYFGVADMKSDRYPTYYDARRHAIDAGHGIDNAGWRRKMLMWNFNMHAIDGYPEWEIENPSAGKYERGPAFVKLTHTRGKGGVESRTLCNAWDDVAEADFYQRDWTDDGIPFVREGETYWSGWWFATIAERDRFVRWHQENGAALINARNTHGQ